MASVSENRLALGEKKKMLRHFCPNCGTLIHNLASLHCIANKGTDARSYYQCCSCSYQFITPITADITESTTSNISNSEKLSYRQIKYFWNSGNIYNFIYYQQQLPELKRRHPEIVEELEDLEFHRKVLNKMINDLPDEDE